MSLMTVSPAAGDFGDWDDFLAFAAITRDFDLADLDSEGQPRTRRPHRGADKRDAINKSLKED